MNKNTRHLPMRTVFFIVFIASCYLFSACSNQTTEDKTTTLQSSTSEYTPAPVPTPEGMVWIPAKKFTQGALPNDEFALEHEKPAHEVYTDGFFIDIHEVTNKEFKKFVEETGYVTVAERPIDWEEMRKSLPPDTPKPPDSMLAPGSLTFNRSLEQVTDLNNYYQWWSWVKGANWRQPYGQGTTIEGKDNFPVVHIAFEDALAYCKWANRRLPTEAEWEAAARGTFAMCTYTWGDDDSKINEMANTWQGIFPTKNESKDGFEYISPVKSYPPNSAGIYDMAGNVWEWTQDWYHANYYKSLNPAKTISNPTGSSEYFDPQRPYEPVKVIKGGSFLCHSSYCASYRVSARMASSMDTGSDHLGFRTVADPDMLK
ncbi:formylglycine-generating enzyme family protein [Marinigracilibium pacificum]|uniref:Formylglycine-generating enzyme family protein n=1 Tax=Marinigracilibium pacificum TaxID=2729599 RepID=A0A848J565_9BACT|nr:formylglycine-generating enzyme family protein [Marinigracilibium pacificum]NMM50398.1 formylglycine-generating enzyme family protein [Marinigracilibium pacificum]